MRITSATERHQWRHVDGRHSLLVSFNMRSPPGLAGPGSVTGRGRFGLPDRRAGSVEHDEVAIALELQSLTAVAAVLSIGGARRPHSGRGGRIDHEVAVALLEAERAADPRRAGGP